MPLTLEPKSVKKRLKDKAFAAKVDREIIKTRVEIFGVDFDEHVRFVIDGLKPPLPRDLLSTAWRSRRLGQTPKKRDSSIWYIRRYGLRSLPVRG
jgi:hypothetical protein